MSFSKFRSLVHLEQQSLASSGLKGRFQEDEYLLLTISETGRHPRRERESSPLKAKGDSAKHS